MNGKEILMGLSYIDRRFLEESEGPLNHRNLRPLLVAAVIAISLLLVGCTVAYAQGWFGSFFAARSDGPLRPEQVEYIQENEQVIRQTQSGDGWTVELASAISDGETGYVLFRVTAPETVDLEGYYTRSRSGESREAILPGNTGMTSQGGPFFNTSVGIFSEENNLIWQCGHGWEADNDGTANTLNYALKIRADRFDPNRPMGLENPFDETAFTVCFENFVRSYEDPEIRQAIDEKYAGQDYLIGGEELEGLYQFEVLAEARWEFSVTFQVEALPRLELITQPVMTQAQVHRKIDNGTMFYDTTTALEQVEVTSFLLKPLGAEILYRQEADMLGAFFAFQNDGKFGAQEIFAVMKDGSRIGLHTDSYGNLLTAESPIVLTEVDHVLLGDGVKLPVP